MKAEIKERIAMIERGEVPEGYKKRKKEIMPEKWAFKKCNEMAEVIDGDRSSNYPNEKDVVDDGILFLSAKNIKKSRIDLTAKRFITQQKFQSLRKGHLQNNDLIITMRGSIGNVVLFENNEYETAFINAQMSIIRPIKDDVASFLWMYLNSESIQSRLIKGATGSAQQQLTKSDIENLPILILPDEEQKKVVSVFSIWDRAIELKEKLLEQKKIQKKGLMERLLSREIRLADYVGKWQFVKLKQIAKRITNTLKSTQVPVLTISSLSGFLLQSERFSKVIAGKNIAKYTHIQKNDFAYNKGNSKTYPYGCIFRLEDCDEALIPNVYYSFKIEGNNSTFYKYYFESGILNHQLNRVINTGVRNDGLLNLAVDDFFKVGVHVPPLEEQEEIAEIFTVFDMEIQLLMQELSKLKIQKKGLMQLLLTGKVRVSC